MTWWPQRILLALLLAPLAAGCTITNKLWREADEPLYLIGVADTPNDLPSDVLKLLQGTGPVQYVAVYERRLRSAAGYVALTPRNVEQIRFPDAASDIDQRLNAAESLAREWSSRLLLIPGDEARANSAKYLGLREAAQIPEPSYRKDRDSPGVTSIAVGPAMESSNVDQPPVADAKVLLVPWRINLPDSIGNRENRRAVFLTPITLIADVVYSVPKNAIKTVLWVLLA